MLRLADIPSRRAEAASYRTNEVLADFRLAWPSLTPGSREAQEAARDALFRLVTIAEMFAGEHLIEITEQKLPGDELVLRIWDERIPRIVRDWGGRQRGWNELFDVKWKYRYWNELKGFVAARIIAHGMGHLTKSQLRRGLVKEGVSKELDMAKVTLRGYELSLSDSDVERCGRRVRHFIDWLDDESRKMIATLPS
jgi:hypothetical protein